MGLKTKMIAIFTTMSCTLNCKLCGSYVPKFRDSGIHYFADPEKTKQCIDELFKLYDYMEHLDFTGGEPLLWGGLAECVAYASKYRSQFGFLRVVTNGTLLPSEDLLSAIEPIKSQFDFMLDNYGAVSKKAIELKSILASKKIACREVIYHGDDQSFGGWIDFGDLSCKNYSDEELSKVYETCMPAHNTCLAVFDEHLYHCCVAAVGTALGKIPKHTQNEAVSLLDQSITLEEKRSIAEQFEIRL